jgi:two-component system invasion response regulator UvrY
VTCVKIRSTLPGSPLRIDGRAVRADGTPGDRILREVIDVHETSDGISTEPEGPGILVVDDHAIVREGLKRMLEASTSAWRIAEAGDAFAALERLRAGGIDVAIVDISMPGMGGLDLLRRARQEFPALRILMLSMHAEEQYAMRAFKNGANGYLTKDCAPRELVDAVRKVLAGGHYVSTSLAERMVQTLSGAHEPALHTQLSDRELEVLRRLASGQRPTDIARELHLSIKTVSTYKSRILERLQLGSTAALIRYAMEHDLVDALPARPA